MKTKMTIGRCGAEIVKMIQWPTQEQPPGTTSNDTVSRASWNYSGSAAHPKRWKMQQCSLGMEVTLSNYNKLSSNWNSVKRIDDKHRVEGKLSYFLGCPKYDNLDEDPIPRSTAAHHILLSTSSRLLAYKCWYCLVGGRYIGEKGMAPPGSTSESGGGAVGVDASAPANNVTNSISSRASPASNISTANSNSGSNISSAGGGTAADTSKVKHSASSSSLGDASGVAILLGNHAKFGSAERCW